MTNLQVLQWIKAELSPSIQKAIDHRIFLDGNKRIYSESLLAAIACREVGGIIAKNAGKYSVLRISELCKGDFTKRKGEVFKQYHGFGFWQIDIASFKCFVMSGDWKDPVKCCVISMLVLKEKENYIRTFYPGLNGEQLLQATIAAYNCGQGRVVQILKAKKDIDSATAHGNYSKSVLEFQKAYQLLS